MKTILEGMRSGDLEDLVLPLLSVDEYESKIDDESVVFAFYVSEKGAAEDLNRYLQRSPVNLLDTEISPAPDQHGYYMVFVELLRNDQTAKNIADILEEVSPLTNIETWSMHMRGTDHLVPFKQDVLDEFISKNTQSSDVKSLHEAVLDFLTPSHLSNAWFDTNQLYVQGGRSVFTFECLAFGARRRVFNEHQLNKEPVRMDLHSVSACVCIQSILGEGWSVTKVSDAFIIQRNDSTQSLLVRMSPD